MPSQELPYWIGAIRGGPRFLRRLPEMAVPDNCRTGVKRACRYEPELNPAYQEMAASILNQRRFRKREGTRVSLFVALECPCLQPLPAHLGACSYRSMTSMLEQELEVAMVARYRAACEEHV